MFITIICCYYHPVGLVICNSTLFLLLFSLFTLLQPHSPLCFSLNTINKLLSLSLYTFYSDYLKRSFPARWLASSLLSGLYSTVAFKLRPSLISLCKIATHNHNSTNTLTALFFSIAFTISNILYVYLFTVSPNT